MTVADRRARFHALHAGDELFVMPNPWDVGSAKLLAACGFPAHVARLSMIGPKNLPGVAR